MEKELSEHQPHGIWAALPLPWDQKEELDVDRYRADIEYLCSSGIHGIYSGGTTGEFYALDFDEFVLTNRILLQDAHSLGIPVQVGVTALSTREVLRRTAWAVERGAEGVQVALPFWLPLDDKEVVDFFRDVAHVASGAYLVHYATMRAKRSLGPSLYTRIRQEVPQLAGIKYAGSVDRIPDYLKVLPDLDIFVGEYELCQAVRLGATGSYSSLVLTNPGLTLRFFQACWENRKEAESWSARVQRLHDEVIYPVYAGNNSDGFWDSAIDRLQAMLNPHMQCGLRCRRPYRFGTPDDLKKMRTWIERNDPELLVT